MKSMPPPAQLLRVEHLDVTIRSGGRDLPIIRDFSLRVGSGEIVAIVGESGSGNSVLFQGRELTDLDQGALRALRGAGIGMVFQDPLSALNPVLTIGAQLLEALRAHRAGAGRAALKARAIELLAQVRLPDPERVFKSYPFELSGGMRQRVLIAMALSCSPALLIADEPTTALDVTVQQGILELLATLRRELGMGVLLITHDLGVVAGICDRVVVMYAGRNVEQAPTASFFAQPLHPYAQALLAAAPGVCEPGARLYEIPGMVPAPGPRGPGCDFAPRCARATPECQVEPPPAVGLGAGRSVACHHIRSPHE